MKTMKFFKWILPLLILIGYFACQKVDLKSDEAKNQSPHLQDPYYANNTRIIGGNGLARNAIPEND